MSLKIELNQKLSQKLNMTTQLRQAIQILNMNMVDLSLEIQKQLEENPVLEIADDSIEFRDEGGEEKSEKEVFEETEIWFQDDYNDDDRDYDLFTNYPSKDELVLENLLLGQVADYDLNEKENLIFLKIIQNLDEQGFLAVSPEELAIELQVSLDEIYRVKELVNYMEPTGIGTIDTAECILVQLKAAGLEDQLPSKLIFEDFDLIVSKKYKTLAKKYEVPESEIIQATKKIIQLKPYPIYDFKLLDQTRYIIPDLLIKIGEDRQLKIMINEEILPNVALSPYYLELINQNLFDQAKDRKFIKSKFKDATFFLQAIFQRHNTIKKVAECIFKYQNDFIEKGTASIKALTLKDVAREVGVHESTVSRAINEKYIETPRGIFPLKHFFSNKLASGDASSNQVQSLIAEIIAEEDPEKPLSDQSIARILGKKEIKIARRTVAKYREELNIPSTRLRKKLSKLN